MNEYSARYSILDREFYIPAPDKLAAQSSVNNQGRGEVLQGEEAARVLDLLKQDAMRSYDNYEAMLSQDGQQGLARELARMNLPANIYTQWYWKSLGVLMSSLFIVTRCISKIFLIMGTFIPTFACLRAVDERWHTATCHA